MSTVTREIETTVDENGKCTSKVTLDVKIDNNETYYLIDEVYPAGWRISDVSDYGSYESQPGHVKWVVIAGAHTMKYEYVISAVNAPESNVFYGKYMVEGDKVEQDIDGESVIKVAGNVVKEIKAYELVADDAKRTSHFANIEAKDALQKFITQSEIVAALEEPGHEEERYAEHNADITRDIAIEKCAQIVNYGIIAVAAAEEAMAVAVSNREMLHATYLVNRTNKNAEAAETIVSELETEINKYENLTLIQRRSVRAAIVINLQKEQEARIIGDTEAMNAAIEAKNIAQAKIIELYK